MLTARRRYCFLASSDRPGARLDYSASSPAFRFSRSLALRGLCAALVLAPWTVMAERFDVVAFDAPPGWTRQALGDGLMFETRSAGTQMFCQIFLRKSRRPITVETDVLQHR